MHKMHAFSHTHTHTWYSRLFTLCTQHRRHHPTNTVHVSITTK